MVEITVLADETPKVIEGLKIDEEVGVAKITIRGNLCCFDRTDSPIIECFRAAEQHAREKDPKLIAMSAGCPMFNPDTGLTECVFLPNMVSCKKGADFKNELEKAVQAIKPHFDALLRKFFEVPEGYRAFKVRYELIDSIKHKNEVEYRIIASELASGCNSSLKSFIAANGVSLPKKRGVRELSAQELKLLTPVKFIEDTEALLNLGLLATC